MAKTIIRAQMKQRIDTIENWEAKNPVLLNGELSLISNDQRYKVGDGSTAWNDLPYRGAGSSITIDSELSETSENPVQNKVVTEALNEMASITYVDERLADIEQGVLAYVDTAIENSIKNTLNTAV